jgi:CheY-like chemotaxis protein
MAPLPQPHAHSSGTYAHAPRVLIVDDESRIVDVLRRLLSDEFEVTTTTRPAQALELLTSGTWFDVVLCDVNMPTMNGIELRNRLHATHPEQAGRIVFVTGEVQWNNPILESVPNTILGKPFDVAALRDFIRRRVPAARAVEA